MADISGRVHVVDGDTFRVGNTPVRIHGIDAPEKDQTCRNGQGVDWACGAWVSAQVRALYQNKRTSCTIVTRDRYDRYVATCRVDGQDVGKRLVGDGLAFAYRRYSMAYDLDEKAAFVAGRGLHGNTVQNPAAYRQSRTKGKEPPDPNCVIKGNISSKGVRIFHSPGQRDYANTGINTAKGERWFCSAAEARAAGWRAARR